MLQLQSISKNLLYPILLVSSNNTIQLKPWWIVKSNWQYLSTSLQIAIRRGKWTKKEINETHKKKEQKHQTLGEHHIPAALRSKTEAGGVFKTKVKLLSCEQTNHETFKSCSIYPNLRGRKTRKRETHIVDRNFNRNNIASLVGGPSIVILTESHDIHTLGTQRWPDGRCRSGLPRLQSQLNHSSHCNNKRESRVVFRFSVISQEPNKGRNSKESLLPFLDLPPGLGGAIEMTVRALGVEERNGHFFVGRNWSEMLGTEDKFRDDEDESFTFLGRRRDW